MDLNNNNYINNNRISVYIKPNKPENKIIGYDKDKNALIIEINSIPEDGKANKGLLKFMKKLTKRQWKIVSGYKSRKKILEIQ